MNYNFENVGDLPTQYISQLTTFLDAEIGHYPAFYEGLTIHYEDVDDEFEYFTVTIENCKPVYFKISANQFLVKVGDNWFKTKNKSWKVKHFWMALLYK